MAKRNETAKVKIWFLGLLVEVECLYESAEYQDGFMVHGGYWEPQTITNPETGMDAWLDLYIAGSLDDEPFPVSEEAWNWLDQPVPEWYSDNHLYHSVLDAVNLTLIQIEGRNYNTWTHETNDWENLL